MRKCKVGKAVCVYRGHIRAEQWRDLALSGGGGRRWRTKRSGAGPGCCSAQLRRLLCVQVVSTCHLLPRRMGLLPLWSGCMACKSSIAQVHSQHSIALTIAWILTEFMHVAQ